MTKKNISLYLIASSSIFFGIFFESSIIIEYLRNVSFYNYTIILILLLFFALIVLSLRIKTYIKLYDYDKPLTLLIISFLIVLFILDLINIIIINYFPLSYFLLLTKIVSIIGAAIVFLIISGNYTLLIKNLTYCYLLPIYYISITGILIFLLAIFDLININDWREHASHFKKFDEGDGYDYYADETLKISKGFYSFPFYLSLITIGDNPASFFGINFFRMAGLFIEPHIAAFISTPAFFLSRLMGHYRLSYIILLFLLTCVSITNLSILMFLYFLYLVKNTKYLLLFIFILSIILTLQIIYNFNFYIAFEFFFDKFKSESFLETLEAYNFLSNEKTLFGQYMFSVRETGILNNSVVVKGMLLLISLIILVYSCVKYLFYKIDYTRVFPLIYIMLHSFKNFDSMIFYYFFWYIVLISIFLFSEKLPVLNNSIKK